MTDRLERIKVCLNGRRGKADHPAVPVTPDELAAEAAAAVKAGAEAVHLHARGGDGAESVRAADVGAAVAAVRMACPGTAIGVSTGLWITGGDAAARQDAVAGWGALPPASRPDFASVNVFEPGAAAVAETLEAAGIGAEAGVWSPADARLAGRMSPARGWLRIMVEIPGGAGEDATAIADQILGELAAAGATAPRLLHGEDETCWPLIRHAGRLGLATRIGLEDVIVGPGGEPAGGNGELISRALEVWTAASRR
jgi:uncharacterized protein (DUF849 family)